MKPYDESMLKAVEEFVANYQKKNGMSPALRIIGKTYPKFFGNSIAKIQRYVQELDKRGLIRYSMGVGIETSPKLLSGKTQAVSLVGNCPCGTPMTAIENIEGTYSLPVEIFGNTPHFILRAVGHSMIEAGIDDGDYMIVRQQNYAEKNEIVIALIEDSATAKVFIPKKNSVVLRACNSLLDDNGKKVYKDIVAENCEILGVVDKVIHTPRVK